ncbi:hypothetical protein SAMD00023353_1900610 [Rosellinia necatrix]|uniref:Uncharacterized protein n=1 Tax=Rosellinia necatrix TaxID=77044 RepID=A0A1W2TES0_ROSNE|nr:hypothetical protein SAMD00023353_1900610 [Rosellinia necatrix]
MLSPKYTCAQCARRLGQLSRPARLSTTTTTTTRPSGIPIPRLSHTHTPPPPAARSRLYSTTAPTAVRGKGRAVVTREYYAQPKFSRADVPPLEFWEARARPPLVADLGADECLRTARAYVDAARKDGPGWRERLIAVKETPDDDGGGKGAAAAATTMTTGKTPLSAYVLHYVASMLWQNHAGQSRFLAMHILRTLTVLGYAPSLLTMVRLGLMSKRLDQPPFEPAREALERLMRRIGDGNGGRGGEGGDFAADACTLRALIYAAEETHAGDTEALRWLRRAYETDAAANAAAATAATTTGSGSGVSSADAPVPTPAAGGDGVPPFNPRWQWKLSFALTLAQVRLRRGELERARDAYAIAASDLDSAAGHLGLASVLQKLGAAGSAAERLASLERAAASGDPAAAREMGKRERYRATEPGLGRWEKRKRQVVADEWLAVADYAAAPTKV